MNFTEVRYLQSLRYARARQALAAFLLLVGLSLVLPSRARAQSALDGFDPNANGIVRAVVVQADGKILIGGDFTSVSPNGGAAVTRNHIARFNADGTLDAGFNPDADRSVFSIAVQADGNILAGGNFLNIGGRARNHIARLNATTGSAELFFAPEATGAVYTIVVQVDTKILVGGQFSSIGGLTRNKIARLYSGGTADSFFDPNANGNVFAIAVQGDGKILVGGDFTNIGGQVRNFLARLEADTGLADSFVQNTNSFVETIAVQADGEILAGGHFTFVSGGGIARNHIARLNTDGALDQDFDPDADGDVFSIVVQPDGNILVGGDFTDIGGARLNGLGRLNAAGVPPIYDIYFDPDVEKDSGGGTVLSIAVQSDGKILAGGDFTFVGGGFFNGVPRNRIVRLEADGKVDQTLNAGLGGDFVTAIAVQPDGKILIGGTFSRVAGGSPAHLARLNSDGTFESNFVADTDGTVNAIAVQNDGKILLGGSFSSPAKWIARLNTNGTVDGGFNMNADGQVLAFAVQSDGNVLVGGDFTSIGGQARNRLARLAGVNHNLVDGFNPDAGGTVYSIALQPNGKVLVSGAFTTIGTVIRRYLGRLDVTTGLADSFDPSAGDAVYAIAVQTDGKILAGGKFLSMGGQTHHHIARLNADGTLDTGFNPDADGEVNSIVVQADGKVLIGGTFGFIDAAIRNGIARLDALTGAADSFDPNANNTVNSIALLADGKILAGGSFTTIGAQTRNHFARLLNDTPAFSALKVTQNTITLTRGGSAPQFSHATFGSDYNFDGIFGLVGNGVPQGSGFTLSGLNFPTGQNFLIRSRGYFQTGYANRSETTEYDIRNVFLRKLRIVDMARNGPDIVITYDAMAANTYRLESKSALTDPSWLPIRGVSDQTPNLDGAATFLVPGAISSGRAFYRVRLLP